MTSALMSTLWWRVVVVLCVLVASTATLSMAVTTMFVPSIMDSFYESSVNPAVSSYAIGLRWAAEQSSNDLLSFLATAFFGGNIVSKYSSISKNTNAMTIFGQIGPVLMSSLMVSLPSNSDLMVFAPYAQFFTADQFATNYLSFVMWTIPSEATQAAGLISFFASQPHFPLKQLVVTLSQPKTGSSNGIGDQAYWVLNNALTAVGISVTRVTSASDYSSGVATKPQLMYLIAQTASNSDNRYYADSVTWATNILTDKTLGATNTSLGFTYDMFSLMYSQFSSTFATTVPAIGSGLLPENQFYVTPTPGSSSTEYQVTQSFLDAVDHTSSYAALAVWEHDFIMTGWVFGTAMLNAISMYCGPALTDRQTFFGNFVAAQSSFLVSDLFIGSFGPTGNSCSSVAESQGALCTCNQAGVNAFMATFKHGGSGYDSTPVPNFVFRQRLTLCGSMYPFSTSSPQYVRLLQEFLRQQLIGFTIPGSGDVSSMCDEVSHALQLFGNGILVVNCVSTTAAAAGTALSTQLSTYVTNGLMGVIPDAAVASASLASTFVLDFIPETTQPQMAEPNLVYLFPTLNQELYILASYLHGLLKPTSVVCGVVRSSASSDEVAALLTKTLTAFEMSVATGNMQQPTTGTLGSAIPAGCTHTFVIGVGSADAAGLLTYLANNPDKVVFTSFDDVTKWYSSYQSAFATASSSVTDRLIFATNIPSWTDMSLTFGSAALPTGLASTPASVRACIVAMVYAALTKGEQWGLKSLQAPLYASRIVNVGNMRFGPFFIESLAKSGTTTQVMNYGAQGLSVWSYTRVVVPTTPTLTGPLIAALEYVVGSTSKAVAETANDANEQNCVVVTDSSVATDTQKSDGSTSSLTPSESVPTTNPTPSLKAESSSRLAAVSSSHEDNTLTVVIIVLCALIGIGVVVICVLLLLKWGAFTWMGARISSLTGRDNCQKDITAAEDVRTSIDKEAKLDSEQQSVVCDSAQTPAGGQLGFVFVEVEKWRALWLRQPQVMVRAVRHVQRCVRRAFIEHQCYEMQTVEGMTVGVCGSAETVLKAACAVVAGASELAKDDVGILAKEYVELGCGACGVPGLRLRVAVHWGTATKRVDGRGRVQWSGGAVDSVVSAAYSGGSPGVVVVTAAMASALADAGCPRDDLQLMTRCKYLDCGVWRVLYAWYGLNGVVPQSDLDKEAHDSAILRTSVACRMLSIGAAHGPDSVTVKLCNKRFDAFYSRQSDTERARSLRWIPKCCGLPIREREACASERDYCTALQTCVKHHIASVLQCRHGLSHDGTPTSSASKGLCAGTHPLSGAVDGDKVTSRSASTSRMTNRSARKSLRSGQRAQLQHFSYFADSNEFECESL